MVQFLPELIEPILVAPEMVAVRRLLDASSRGLRFHQFDQAWVVASIESLIDERGPGRIVLLLDVLAKLSALPDVEPIATLGFQWDANASQQARIEAVWQRLMRSFGEEITQAQIASEVNMSVSAFSRFFRRAANMSFTDALIEIRLGHASRLLLEDEKNVSEICFESGFKNLSNFNRLFKKRYSCTPREWRRQLESSAAG